jgi:hypothetical protein
MADLHGDLREPRPTSTPTRTLQVPLRPTDDPHITCVVCNRDGVEFEIFSRTPERRQFQGLHERCAATMGVLSAPR